MAVKLFCPENLGVGKLEAIEYQAGADAKIGNKIFFIDAVTVGKGVPVQKDIS